MKLSLCAFLLAVVVGCSKDDDSSDNNSADNGQLVAKIDGSDFSVKNQVAATLYNGFFNITAIKPSTGETITITVSDAGEGTFDLGPDENALSGAAYNISGEDSYGSAAEGGSGEIKITKIDTDNNTVTGTFKFTAIRESFNDNGDIITETITITNGAFNKIPLASDISGNGNNSFKAKIKGKDLNADAVSALEINIGGSTTIAITGNNNITKENVSLTFPKEIAVGTYELGGAFSDYIGSYNPNLGGGTNNYYSESGTLNITTNNASSGKIEGTFSFNAKRLDPNDPNVNYQVTNGSFSVEL